MANKFGNLLKMRITRDTMGTLEQTRGTEGSAADVSIHQSLTAQACRWHTMPFTNRDNNWIWWTGDSYIFRGVTCTDANIFNLIVW